MARLFKTKPERKKGLWKRVVDLALTDVRVAAGGIDLESLERLEERLLAADFGVPATLRLTDKAEDALRRGRVRGSEALAAALKDEIREILTSGPAAARGSGAASTVEGVDLASATTGPTVYLMVGVNGVGKTTSVAKLAHALIQEGNAVMVAAADTFRAGAVAQLENWASRVGADFLRGQAGGDPAAVAYDALEAAEARGTDVVLIDTAGRLHTNQSLMDELSKIDRVVRRRMEGAPHETLIVLDATVGQNALRQVEAFSKAVSVTGIVLAKMDSSARGGIVVALREEFGVPVKLVGTGEAVDDLEAFGVDAFVDGVFGT
jgi:fused signal recognition particle receptor